MEGPGSIPGRGETFFTFLNYRKPIKKDTNIYLFLPKLLRQTTRTGVFNMIWPVIGLFTRSNNNVFYHKVGRLSTTYNGMQVLEDGNLSDFLLRTFVRAWVHVILIELSS